MCILQDSAEDWEIESAKMSTYYGDSWLTIAAGVDGSIDGGLFGQKPPLEPERQYFRHKLFSSVDVPNFLYLMGDDERLVTERSRPLLYSRGWTLQEEALSPHFLTFQAYQVSLRINNIVFHESGSSQHISETNHLNVSGYAPMSWKRTVENNSRRHLTKEMDKLPALSGLAHKYHDTNPDV